MFSRTTFIVRFFHRASWVVFEEYGPTMRDVAIDKAYALSKPFGSAEVRVVQTTETMTSWEDGILLELLEYQNEHETNHFIRFP